MGIFRAIWSIILATLVAAIIGAMFDYLRPQFFGEGMDYKFLYPWVTGVAGLFAALIAVGLTGGFVSKAQPTATPGVLATKPQPHLKKQEPKAVAKKAETKDSLSVKTSTEVPGMPTFDVDRTSTEKQPPDKAKESK